MLCSRVFGLLFVLPSLACRMVNPAFDDDELGDESSESSASESSASEVGSTSESGDAGSSSDEATSAPDTSDTTSESTGDATSESTDVSESETGVGCMPGETDCGGRCVDTQTDPFNCGECENACGEGHLCIGGCVGKKYVFVSSELRTGAMGSILGADELCNGLADQAGLPGTYLAWNSIDGNYPNSDFDQTGAYVRTDEELIASSYADLTDGSILVPINLDENQGPVALGLLPNCPAVIGPVWSNTTPAGDYAGGPNCTGWTLGTALVKGKIGSMSAIDGTWSQIPDCEIPCNTPMPIYCVQQTP